MDEMRDDLTRWLDPIRRTIDTGVADLGRDITRLDPRRPPPPWARPGGVTAIGIGGFLAGLLLGVLGLYLLDGRQGPDRRRRLWRRVRGVMPFGGGEDGGSARPASGSDEPVRIPVAGDTMADAGRPRAHEEATVAGQG